VVSLPAWLDWLPEGAGLGAVIEHTLLRPDAPRDAILRLCADARGLGCRAVCVHGQWLPACRSALAGTAVLGQGTTASRVAEIERLVDAGADEIDVVALQEALAAGDWAMVERDLVEIVRSAGRPVKVILETAALTAEAIVAGAALVRDAGAFAVKTSTGFHPAGGATVEAVSLMRESVGRKLRVKASGGVRTVAHALAMLRAGADLVGTSAAGSWTAALGPTAPSLAQLLADLV